MGAYIGTALFFFLSEGDRRRPGVGGTAASPSPRVPRSAMARNCKLVHILADKTQAACRSLGRFLRPPSPVG